MNAVDLVESAQLRDDLPDFNPGDQVRVEIKLTDDTRRKKQVFEGVVIRHRGGGLGASFTVRKVSYGEGVERTFPLHSPLIESIQVLQRGKVRRARLYYLRDRKGKAAKVKPKDIR